MDNFEITFELEENSEIDATFELDEQKEFDCLFEVNTSGTIDHNKLINRDMANQHPISAITELENELTELHQTDSDNYDTLNTKIDDTKADIQQDITSLSSTVQSNYNTLNNKIDTVNQELTSDIDNLAEDVAKDVLELQQNINTEATTRAESDTLLQNNINTLTDDVSSKYDTLSGLITNEISNRTQADDNLQVQINAKQPQGDYATNNRVNEVAQDVVLNKNQIEVAFETMASDKAELQANIDTVDDRVDVNEANIDTLTNTKADKSEIPSIPTDISAFNNDVGYITDSYHDVTKQDVIEDLGTIRVNAQIGAGLSTQVGDNTSNIAYLDEKVREIELFKFPNAVIIGEPNISNGQVSGFSTSNYMQFPFILDLHDQAFQIDFCFTTATNVTTQQNILDSNFGLALAIQNSKGVMAISSNGTSWNIGSATGSITIQPNTTYYARLTWNKLQYKTALSTDGVNYTEDMVLVGATRPYPRTIFIGGCDNVETGHTPHPFLGSINMNKASLTVMGNLIWQGMDDAGLATRADISLSNLDSLGEARFTAKQDKLTAGENITIENNVISASGGDTSDCVHITGEETITGKKIFTGGSGGSSSDVSLQTKNALAVGDQTQTNYTGIYNHRKCSGDSNYVNTAGFLVNSDGSAKFTHKRGSTTAIGTADDSYIRFNKTTLVYSDSSSATSEKDILHTGNAYNKTSIDNMLNNKQDTINDLSIIRSNATAGKSVSDIIATYGDIVTYNADDFQPKGDYASNTALTTGLNSKQDTISDLATIRDGASKGATALQSIPIAKANVVGGVAGGNWLTVNQTTGKMECGELTKAQFDSANGYTFIGKTTLNNVLADYTKSSNIKTINGESIVGTGDITIKSAPDLDNVTISKNSNDELQAIALIEDSKTYKPTDFARSDELNNPYSLLEYKYSELEITNNSWLKSNGQWNTKVMYPSAYEEVRRIGKKYGQNYFTWQVLGNTYYTDRIDVQPGDSVFKLQNNVFTQVGYVNDIEPNITFYVVNVGTNQATRDVITDYDFVCNETDETFRLPLKTKTSFVIDEGEENGIKYRIWNNGWCEQGGAVTGTGTQTILLTKTYSDTSWNFTYGQSHTATLAESKVLIPSTKRTDSFQLVMGGTAITIYWKASGYLASDQYTPQNLYYYVGDTVQNASLIDVAQITSALSNKVDINSKVIDGQWVGNYLLANNSTAIGTYTVDLSDYLPDDGYDYEVQCHFYLSRSDSNGTNTQLRLFDKFGDVNVSGTGCLEAHADGSNFQQSAQCGIIIVGANRLIYEKIENYKPAYADLYITAYRRLGTNE